MGLAKTTSNRKPIAFLVAIVVIVALFIISSWYLSQRWILAISASDSMNTHFVVIDKKDKNVKKGDVIGFYYCGKKMYDYKNGDRFIKYLVCDEGDKLTVKNRSYYCNGKFIDKAIKVNSHGDTVQHFIYNGIIPKGKFFAWTPNYYSYDSRYWGFGDKKDIIGKGYLIFL